MSNYSTTLKIKNNSNWRVKFCVEHTTLCKKFRSVHTIFNIQTLLPACVCVHDRTCDATMCDNPMGVQCCYALCVSGLCL